MSWIFLIPITEALIGLIMAWIILRSHRPPVVSLAWLMLVFLNPYVGALIYLVFGVKHLGRFRAKEHNRIADLSRKHHDLEYMLPFVEHPEIAPAQKSMVAQAECISGNPIVGGNNVEPIQGMQEYADRLIADIDRARHHVHLLYYIYRADKIGNQVSHALIRAAGRKVKCRLLVDAAGSRHFLKSTIARKLRQEGVEIVAALPVQLWRHKLARMDLRNHRKISVIDGQIAYTGSHNIVEETYGHKRAGRWVDLSGRFTGPIVAQMQSVFLQDWEFDSGHSITDHNLFPAHEAAGDIPAQAVATGPSNETENFRRVLLAALNSANQRIIMTTPYLVPDEPTMLALSMAADRGVNTTIIVPAKSNHLIVNAAGRSYYQTLLEAGVNIHRFYGGMLHAKTTTVDDSFALVGSANFDIRSFKLNFEINMLLYGGQITSQVRFAQNSYLSQCEPVDLQTWQQRSSARRVVDNAAALLSPLL